MITWPVTITQHASLWVHTPGECAREATEEDLAAAGFVRRQDYDEAVARIAELEAESTSRTRRDLAGTCPHCHNDPCTCTDFQRAYKPPSNDTPEQIAYSAKNYLTAWVIVRRIQALIDASKSPAHRQAIDDLRIARAQRDTVLDRSRRAAQILIAEFGADGPLNVDEAAERAVKMARGTAYDLHAALVERETARGERDAVVDRICEAVRWERPSPRWDHDSSPLGDNVLIGKMHLACGFGQTLVGRIRAEIRKAAGGSYDE